MAYQLFGPILSLVAAADFSSSQYCAVNIDTNGKAALPSAGGAIVGVLIDDVTAGQACAVQMHGVAKWKLGGTVAKGDLVKVDTSGRAVTASGSDVAAGMCVGRCVEGGAINNYGSILLNTLGVGYVAAGSGMDDVVLGTTAPSNLTSVTYAQVTGTKTGALAAGVTTGQTKDIVQSVAASTPVGTITGTFKTNAGAAATTLALGTAVGFIIRLVWDGSAWRQVSAIGGTGSSLS